MKAEKYLEKTGVIYGVSYKYGGLGYYGSYVVKFYDIDIARRWLNTEEYDFRTRELASYSRAIEIVGAREIEQSTPWYEMY